MAQFQEMMRQQLESSMQTELEKLLDTSTGSEKEVHQHTPPLPPPPVALKPSGCDLEFACATR